MATSLKSSSFSEHETNLFDGVVVDMEDGFSRSHDHGTEDFSNLYSIKPGRDFTKKSSTRGADHEQIEASLYRASKVEKSTETIVGVAPDHHHINVGNDNLPTVEGLKQKLVVKRCRSSRASSPWIFRPRRLLFLFATLSSMGTMILIYLTFLISKGNNPTT